MTRGIVFTVAGAKGGVGKTTTSINLGAVLATRGRSVLLVELDLAMANVGDFLDLDVRLDDGRDPTLHEVLAGTATLEDATYDAPGGFDVVPSGITLDGFTNTDIGDLSAVVREARSRYDVVILDTGAGVATENLLPMALADATILVSSPRVASIRDTEKTRDLVRHVDGLVAGIVFVKSGTGRSPDVDHIAHFLDVDLLGHVPEDGAVANAQDIGQPVVLAEQDSDAARAYEALGGRIDALVGPLRDRAADEAAETEAGATTQTRKTAASRNESSEELEATNPDGTGFGFVDETAESAGRRSGTTAAGGRSRGATGTARASHDTDFAVRSHDGTRIHVARDERLGGVEAAFHPVYVDPDREECYGWACSCGNVGLAVDPAGRLDCDECGNRSRATCWDDDV